MFDFAWSEFALIGLVAVVVLGPKELPQAMRALGRFTRQARKLAGEFQGHVNDLMREAELDEVRSSVQKVTNVNVGAEIDKLLDPGGEFSAELARTEAEVKAALGPQPGAEAQAAPAPLAEPPAEPAAATTPEAPPEAPAHSGTAS
jgi:sec-independent protein translocase protein TatB